MTNHPFRFLDSPDLIRELGRALKGVGLSEQPVRARDADEAPSEPNPYHPACVLFDCPWLSQSVELHWHYTWWPDGTNSELERVCVVYEGEVRGEVDVGALFQQQLARPMADVVVDRIVAACGEVTGKRRRPTKRNRKTESDAERDDNSEQAGE
jgi:hypothetical protein